MKNFFILLFITICCISLSAQERENENKGTIRVQKSGHINKIIFDDVNYRLIGIDEYGNPLDTAVLEFSMSVTIKGIFYKEQTTGCLLSYKMQHLLGKCDQSSKIYFDKIKAKDRTGTIIEMPKLTYSIGSMNDDGN